MGRARARRKKKVLIRKTPHFCEVLASYLYFSLSTLIFSTFSIALFASFSALSLAFVASFSALNCTFDFTNQVSLSTAFSPSFPSALACFLASSGSCSILTGISFLSSLYKNGTLNCPSVVSFFFNLM